MLSCLIIDIIRKADLHEDGFARDHTQVICFIFKKVLRKVKIVSRFDEFETCLSPWTVNNLLRYAAKEMTRNCVREPTSNVCNNKVYDRDY